MKYLKLFENHSQYEDYVESGLTLPNVSHCIQEAEVHYKPYVPQPSNIITYRATEKLPYARSVSPVDYCCGFRSNAFNATMVSHTFENGIGTIEFDNDVTTFGNYAFSDCSGLTDIVIPNTVTSIGRRAFTACTSLSTINIPSGVTSIGDSVFQSCSSLTSCTIGSGVTSIGSGVFFNCGGLKSIISNAMSAPTIQSNTFQNVNTSGTLTVPQGSSGYDVWMGTGNYYLGKYYWRKVEQ